MPRIERRKRAFAAQATVVLREQSVEALIADAAGRVNGLGPRVRTGQAHALAVAPRDLQTAGVVICVTTVLNQLNDAKVGKWNSRSDIPGGAGDRLVRVLETIEVMTHRSQIAGLQSPIEPDLPLYVEQVLHGVRSCVVISSNIRVRWRHLS